MLGAAAACARILKLDTAKTAMALGIAASQPIGVREQFGSMTKAFHIGGAARAGLTSALMARHGYTASMRALEAPRGLLQTYSSKCDWKEISDELGKRFEISFNTYKPLPAASSSIPPSTAAASSTMLISCVPTTSAHRFAGPSAGARATGKRAEERSRSEVQRLPRLRRGDAVRPGGRGRILGCRRPSPRCNRAARSVHAKVDAAIDESAADVTIRCSDGRRLHLKVEHAIGSLQRPMSDSDLERKFHGLVDPVLGVDRAARLVDVPDPGRRERRRSAQGRSDRITQRVFLERKTMPRWARINHKGRDCFGTIEGDAPVFIPAICLRMPRRPVSRFRSPMRNC
jgi:hypothetical protein